MRIIARMKRFIWLWHKSVCSWSPVVARRSLFSRKWRHSFVVEWMSVALHKTSCDRLVLDLGRSGRSTILSFIAPYVGHAGSRGDGRPTGRLRPLRARSLRVGRRRRLTHRAGRLVGLERQLFLKNSATPCIRAGDCCVAPWRHRDVILGRRCWEKLWSGSRAGGLEDAFDRRRTTSGHSRRRRLCLLLLWYATTTRQPSSLIDSICCGFNTMKTI